MSSQLKPRICTYTGVEMWPFDPKPHMIRIEDIAHALAVMPRFAGHTRTPYSVAEHSIRVAGVVTSKTPQHSLAALLHDAAEAYLLDVPSPLKPVFTGYKAAETRLLACILETLDPDYEPRKKGDSLLAVEIKDADRLLLSAERRDLLPHVDWWMPQDGYPDMPTFAEYPRIKPWSWQKAEREFLNMYEELTDGKDSTGGE